MMALDLGVNEVARANRFWIHFEVQIKGFSTSSF
jgi:hypothetical protein